MSVRSSQTAPYNNNYLTLHIIRLSFVYHIGIRWRGGDAQWGLPTGGVIHSIESHEVVSQAGSDGEGITKGGGPMRTRGVTKIGAAPDDGPEGEGVRERRAGSARSSLGTADRTSCAPSVERVATVNHQCVCRWISDNEQNRGGACCSGGSAQLPHVRDPARRQCPHSPACAKRARLPK